MWSVCGERACVRGQNVLEFLVNLYVSIANMYVHTVESVCGPDKFLFDDLIYVSVYVWRDQVECAS